MQPQASKNKVMIWKRNSRLFMQNDSLSRDISTSMMNNNLKISYYTLICFRR